MRMEELLNSSGDGIFKLSPHKPSIAGNPEPAMVVPHVFSFNGIINQSSRMYSSRYDEAIRHMPSNAMAMRRDAFIESLIQERTYPTAQRAWSVIVPDTKDKHQRYVQSCVTECVRAIPRFNSMRMYLSQAVWYGRYGSHVSLVKRRLSGNQLWTVGSHRPVNGDKIQYGWDGVPAVAIEASKRNAYRDGLVTQTDRGISVLKLSTPEHRRQFIIHRHIVDDADYFEPEMAGGIGGVGLRHKVYWAWWLRDEMLSWAVDFMQKVGTLGLLVFMYEDGNQKAKAAAEEAAKAASSETALTMPVPPREGTRVPTAVQHIAASPGGIEALKGMIADYFERHIERLFVGQPSSGGDSGGGLGGSAGAALHADTKYQLLKFDSENLDETITQDLIGVLLELNHPEVDFPVKFKSSVSNPEDAAKLQGIQVCNSMGVKFDLDEVRALTGMSKPDEGAETTKSGEQETSAVAASTTKSEQTTPGQGLTSNKAVERENGSGMSYSDE